MFNFFSYIFIILTVSVSFLFFSFGFLSLGSLLWVLAVIVLIEFFFIKAKKEIVKRYTPSMEEVEEKINLLEEELKEKNELFLTLPRRARKILSLSKVIDKLISYIDREKVYNFLGEKLIDFFPQADNILIFHFDRKENFLGLTYSFKKHNVIIREKRGDIMDFWVLKHNQSLIVEDFSQDFRFDSSQSIAFQERNIHSFISSPLSLGEYILGVVRIESKKKKAFSMDELRLLRIFTDVGAAVLERAVLFQRTKILAMNDALTGVFLREPFLERLKEELMRARITETRVALGLLDIDDFKKINDTYGHSIGDLVLKKLAKILEKEVGNSGNAVARFGGEEFIFFIVHTSREEAKKFAEGIREKLSSAYLRFRRKSIGFSVSLGVAIFPEDARDFLSLMEVADSLLYKAKREGKNKVCFTY
ncbi:MAG: hypothetical protein DRP81_00895 [Candidatus Omnitrophota bacterium]|nr:MAG: hypothetical protein DRP81_00895 [Candidatus Omnitrophota bacterium]